MLPSGPIILIGLDGFDPVLAEKWMATGDLPNLKNLAANGYYSPLKSTIPPFTYPAWSSLITGTNPGMHGMIDFAVRQPGECQGDANQINGGSYDVTYINSSFRKMPTVFKRLSDQGKRVAAMGFPTTYPPEPVNGIMISGFDSPLAVSADQSFCYPPELWNELKQRVHAYTLAGIQELNTGGNWHRKASKRILQTIQERTEIARYLIQKEPWDLFAIVFSESDTAAHHFWAAHDPQSPRHSEFSNTYGSELNDFLKTVYCKLDTAVGQLIETFENQLSTGTEDFHIMIVSDHGSGGTGDTLLSLNRLLEQHDLFMFKETLATGSWLKGLARFLPDELGQWLFRRGPRGLLQRLESSSRLKHADLQRCRAFSDELNYFPSIWIHDQRFPEGQAMSSVEKDALCETIRDAVLSEINLATGEAVFNNVYRREEIYSGPALQIIPDLIVEPALENGFSYAIWNAPCPGPVLEKLPATELRGRKGGSMNGSHRQFGVFYSNRVPDDFFSKNPDITDAGCLLLRLCGLENTRMDSSKTCDAENPYTQEQSQELEKRLKDLGYLD